jgi:hypothetical protein
MTYQFENDIFISYAHIDDQPLTEGEKGWIYNFHRALEIRLGELSGETPKILRDPKLEGNDYFSDIIVEQFLKVTVLVSVLSPRYVKSEWCIKELRKLYQAAEQQSGQKCPPRVYLICDQRDSEDIKPLEDYLFEPKNIEAIPPLFEGNQAESRQYHQDNLSLCDAAIIYYGNANERWLQVQI